MFHIYVHRQIHIYVHRCTQSHLQLCQTSVTEVRRLLCAVWHLKICPTCISIFAFTGVHVEAIMTGSTVEARITVTLFVLDLAVSACKEQGQHQFVHSFLRPPLQLTDSPKAWLDFTCAIRNPFPVYVQEFTLYKTEGWLLQPVSPFLFPLKIHSSSCHHPCHVITGTPCSPAMGANPSYVAPLFALGRLFP